MEWGLRSSNGQGNAPGTPGKRFAEYTVNDSVKLWARIGAEVVMTLFAPGSGEGKLCDAIQLGRGRTGCEWVRQVERNAT